MKGARCMGTSVRPQEAMGAPIFDASRVSVPYMAEAIM